MKPVRIEYLLQILSLKSVKMAGNINRFELLGRISVFLRALRESQ